MDQIAVVGMAGRFPRAETLAAFWRNLRDGVESMSFYSEEELRAAGVDEAFLQDPTYVRAQAMIEGFDRFDAPFFGFSPREAEVTNPQHRLFLEICWQALEDAGIDPTAVSGSGGTVGVFASASSNTYILDLFTRRDILRSLGGLRVQIANEKEFLPTWVSYKLDLRGPSVNVQTACSSSLVAVHMAIQSLLNGECDVALAGGVSVRNLQRRGYFYQEGAILSQDGRCRAFDADSGGTVDGDGAGVVVLKRLDDARRNGDNVQAVILGSAVNNDGALKVGFTAPSEEGQTRVISEALSIAGIPPETLGYVEAHGTGTRLGDPIEIAALSAALRSRTQARGFCAVGSVKTNLGHLDAGAGIAGLIKTVLALKHRELPPSLHFRAPNPEIQLDGGPVYINGALKPWETKDHPRRAGVSSFGIGGTNAHVVLEEAPEVRSGPSREHQLLVWSARTGPALEAATANFAEALADGGPALADVAFTLARGRRAFEHRRALVARDATEAAGTLAAGDSKRILSGNGPAIARRVAFLFPGQGAQRAGATREIYQNEKVFRVEVDRCAELLAPHLGADLRDVLYPKDVDPETAESRLAETVWAQPAVFVVDYALARLWMSWGVRPEALVGHSLGEYVAACLAGVLRLEDALSLVALRGKLMQDLPPGAMLAVPLGEEEVAEHLTGSLALAAINGPKRTVVSGPLAEIEALEARLTEHGHEGRRLRTSHAFHSAMMEPMIRAFGERLRSLALKAPQIPYLSNVTGDWITPQQATDPAFWLRQLREPVRFADAVGVLLRHRDWALLEAGPGRTLTGLVQQHPELRPEHRTVGSLARSSGNVPETAALFETLGMLWASGVEVDWAGFYRGERRRRVSLPTYPFERQRYLIERPAGAAAAPWTELAARQELTQALESGAMNDQEKEPTAMPASHTAETPSPARRALVGLLKQIVHELTGTDPSSLDPQAAFLDIGVDSLLLIQAAQKIRDQVGVKLSVVQFLEELTTLDAVAAYIEEQLPAAKLAELVPREKAPVGGGSSPLGGGGLDQGGGQEGGGSEGQRGREGVSYEQAAPLLTSPLPQPPPAQGGGTHPPAYQVIPAATLQAPPQVFPVQPAPAAGIPAAPASALTQLLSQQLQVLSQQIQLLQGTPAVMAAPAPQPVYAPEAVSPAAPVMAAQPAPVAPAPAPGAPAYTQLGPYQPIETRTSEFTQQQKEYLDQFLRRYSARTAKSKELTETYRPVLSDGRATVSFRRAWKEIVYPIHSQRSKDAHVWDVDGNDYVDISMGFGVHLFGHSPDFLVDAMERQMRRGLEIGPQSPLAGQVAELICSLTGMDRAVFCTSGTEANMGAMRVARVVTGRSKIAILSDSYHGWADATVVRRAAGRLGAMPGAPGVSSKTLEDVVVLEYGSAESIQQIAAMGHELAAVIVEPVRSRAPEVQPREFLQALRQVTRETGTALIFDEMITGFRIHAGGAQAWAGVEADLATYGKLVGGGMPIGVIAGRKPFLDALDGGPWRFGDGSYPHAEKTLFTGTYFKHPLTMAAAHAMLDRMRKLGPALHEGLNARTAELAADLNAYFEASNVPMEIVHFGSLFRFKPRQLQYPELFYFHLVDHGVYFTQESGNCFLGTAHTEEDLERVKDAVRRTVEDLAAGGFLPGAKPVPMPESRRPEVRERSALRDSSVARALAVSRTGRTPSPTLPRQAGEGAAVPVRQGLDFSLYYFGPYHAQFDASKYDLLLAGARFADEHGFTGIWLPERHFHPFGGLSPNPSVLAAALARETKRLRLRAGSVVVPLHHPIRLAEEWSVVDNLSGGRVEVSFASGWHANDFVFAPYSYESRHDVMYEGIEKVRTLWRGEPMRVRDGVGAELDVVLHPLPQQSDIPVWLTAASPATFAKAGEMGAGVLTNLQGQTLEELAAKVALYYETLAAAGHDPASGRVTVLLHTFVGEDLKTARAQVAGPLREYLRASLDLSRKLVQSTGRKGGDVGGMDADPLAQGDLDYILDAAYDRYVADHALVGTPESCAAVAEKLRAVGVTEIGCLIDFGVEPSAVVASLPWLDQVREHFAKGRREEPAFPLVVTPEYREFPVTEGQRVIWLATLMGPGANRSYNEPLALRMRGPLNVPSFHGAIQRVADRHQALRSAFSTDGTRQRIASVLPVQLPLIDYSGLAEPHQAEEVLWCLKFLAGLTFDLDNGPVLRVALLRLSAEEHYLQLTAHHIVIDGGSAGVMMRELSLLYEAGITGKPAPLPRPGLYEDYVRRVTTRREDDPDQIEAEAYWRQVFAKPVNLMDLPLDRPRPRSLPFWGDRRSFVIDAELMAGIRKLSLEARATPFTTVLAALGAMLHELSGQDDIIVGIPARDPSVTGSNVGYFINLLPVRMERGPRETFRTFLTQVRRTVLHVLEHQNYWLNRLLEKLGLAGGLDGFIIGTTFNMERIDQRPSMPELDVEYRWVYHDSARIDLHVNVIEDARDGGGLLEFAYRTTFYNASSADRWLASLVAVLRQVTQDPDTSLHGLPILSEGQRHQMLLEWNDVHSDSGAEVATGATLHELFAAQVARTPTATAVSLGDDAITYADLDRLSTALAGHLATLGVGPEVRVGLCLDRSFELVVCAMAILKAGGAYVPLEPTQPRERLLYFLGDARIPLLLTRQRVIDKLGDGLIDLGTRALDVEAGLPPGVPPLPKVAVHPDNLAYVLYTSGSTGKPNGVQVSHRSAVNLVRQVKDLYDLGPGSKVAMIASLNFDVSVFEIFGSLAYGACLCLIREEELANPVLLADRMAKQGVTAAFATPSRLMVLPERPLAAVRKLGVGGEACTAELVHRWSRGRQLINCYGPTEVTVFSTIEVFEDWQEERTPPIGRPVAGVEAHVVNANLKPVPIGAIGELALGGVQVARGYLNRPEKTALRFVPDPFAAARGDQGARMYLTGDRVRRLADGRLDYLGRGDDQVKLRGFRIELGEIESVIAAQPGVKEAAVVIRGEGTGQMLGAYLVWEDGQTGDDARIEAVRKRVQELLPEYMVPASWIELKELPKTVNGKIDRLVLRAKQKASEEGEPHVDPETPLEKYLVELWSEVLRLDKLSLNDNFLELGGNSINAAMLAFRLQDVLGEIMHAIVIFDAPTVAEMSHFLAVRFPDKVVRIWGEESLPESVRQAMLEFEDLDEAELEELRKEALLADGVKA